MTAKLKVISIRLSALLDDKFTIIIYNRVVALCSASDSAIDV